MYTVIYSYKYNTVTLKVRGFLFMHASGFVEQRYGLGKTVKANETAA